MSHLLKRLDKHFTACVAAAAGAAAIGATADAAIVYSGVLNIVVPTTNVDGIYMNVETGQWANLPGSNVPGWDINPYGTSTTTISFWGTAGQGNGYVRGATSGVGSLAAGTLIGGASIFLTSGSHTTSGGGAWTLNANHLVGFKFLNGANQLRYGWFKMSVGANYGVRSIVEYAYDDTGAGITAGTVPGPAGLAVLALGAVGIRSRRRK